MVALTIKDLSKSFGSTEVLKKINLDIEEGSFIVLLGPSGCGKSTLYSFTLVLDITILFNATCIGAASPNENVAPNKKSFQICVNCQITVTTIIGAEMGTTILKNILKNPAPSILAAFINSLGIET